MSQWTHVNGSIRIDHIRGVMPPIEFEEIFKTCSFEDDDKKWDDCNVPCGSEGSVQINIVENPIASSLAAYTINVFGDLRDYDSYKSIRDWFKMICLEKKLIIRSACIEVGIEYGETHVLIFSDSKIKEFKE